MQSADEIIARLRDLPVEERRRVERALQDLERSEVAGNGRREALDAFIAMGGTVHTDFTDVSTNKQKHLADIYMDRR